MVNRLNPQYNTLKTGSSTVVLPYPYIGLVKNNIDPQNMGRLSVWIPELCGDPTNSGSWIVCSYCSPFFGATDLTQIPNYQSNGSVSQQSYGWVGVPPDLNCEVMVQFVGGELSRAYWTGCVPQQNMDYMVPGIAVGDTTTGTQAPVQEYNKAIQTNTASPQRPVFAPLANGLATEGLSGDNERGGSTTSMRRESPPLVYGYLTPRGNTIHVDDNANGSNEFIRLRTRSGTQILIHETTGYVYINSKAGNSWFEISDAGINAYTANSMSIRTQQDFNIRADRNINIDAGASVNIRAGQQITLIAGTNIEVGATQLLNLTGGTNVEIGATQNLNLSAGGSGSFGTTGDLQFKSGGNLRLQSTSDTSSLAGGNWYRTAIVIYDNGPPAPPAIAPTVSPSVGPTPQPTSDTTQTFSNGGSGTSTWSHGSGSVNTIVSVMPTHEPWNGHPNAFIPPVPASGSPVQSNGTYSAPNPFNPTNPLPQAPLGSPSSASGGCSFGVANTKPISTAVFNAISNASTKTGANAATMFAFADMESSFQPGVSAGTSSASGLFQFTSGTWTSMTSQYGNQYNVPAGASVTDPNYNSLMGGAFIQNNASILAGKGIANPTPGQLYLMHFLGSSGGPAFIAANQNTPDTSAASLFPAPAAANKTLFYNSDGSPKTVSQVYANLTSVADAKATAYSNQFGLPAPCQRGTGVAGNSPSSPAPSPNQNSSSYAQDVGKVYGKGQCVALVQQVSGVGNTGTWQQGDNVQQAIQSGNMPAVGTPIATFGASGTYTNSLDGTSHAAIFLGETSDGSGISVLDQYVGSNGVPVPSRIHTIPFNSTSGQVISNASNYSIINVPMS